MAEKFKVINPNDILADEVKKIQHNTQPENFSTGPVKTNEPAVRTKAEINKANLERGKEIVDKYITNNQEYQKTVENYKKLTETEIKDVTDVTSLNLTSELDVTTVDFNAKGLPNPADYGLDPTAVVDLTSLDGTNWDLPLPELASLNPVCFEGGGLGLSNVLDLSSINMFDFDLPTFDFSWATDWDFPDWMDPSNIDLGTIFDLSSVDLSGVIDLVNVDLPDFDFPEFGNPFDGIELPSMDGLIDGVKGVFDDMSGMGDLIGLGSMGDLLGKAECVGSAIVDALVPDAVANAIKNFEMPDLDLPSFGDLGEFVTGDVDLGGMRDFLGDSDLDELLSKVDDIFGEGTGEGILDDLGLSNDYKGPILTALTFLGSDWMWDDKDRNIYNFDNLSTISPSLMNLLSKSDNYVRAAGIGSALGEHRQTVSRNYENFG